MLTSQKQSLGQSYLEAHKLSPLHRATPGQDSGLLMGRGGAQWSTQHEKEWKEVRKKGRGCARAGFFSQRTGVAFLPVRLMPGVCVQPEVILAGKHSQQPSCRLYHTSAATLGMKITTQPQCYMNINSSYHNLSDKGPIIF